MAQSYVAPDVSIKDYLTRKLGSTFKPDGQDKLKTMCPLSPHGQLSGKQHFKLWENSNSWFCECAVGVDRHSFWDLVSYMEQLPNFGEPGFDDTITHVCGVMGIEPVVRSGGSTDEAEIKKIYNAVAANLSPIIIGPGGLHPDNPHIENGLYRGVEVMQWHSVGVGMLTQNAVSQIMAVTTRRGMELAFGSEFETSDWLTQGVAILRRNPGGQTTGVTIRMYQEMGARVDNDGQLRRKSLKNQNHVLFESRRYLYGLDVARKYGRTHPRLYVVEGEFDQLTMALNGLTNTVACGLASPTSEQMALMRSTGKEIVMIGDHDAGRLGGPLYLKAAEKYHDLKFLLLPSEKESTDPDTFVRQHGIGPLEELRVYTSREVRMASENRDPNGNWIFHSALCDKYMNEILSSPGPDDTTDIAAVAFYAKRDYGVLSSWVQHERNVHVVTMASRLGVKIDDVYGKYELEEATLPVDHPNA